MRVVIATGIYPPEVGGPATYTKKLAESLVNRGHEVRIVTYGESNTPKLNSKVFICVVRRSFVKPWHYYKYYRAVLKHGSWADLLYAQGPISEGFPVYLANKKLHKPFVVKVVGDRSWEQAMNSGQTDKLIDEFQHLSSYPKKIRKMREIQKLVCDSANLVITPSNYLQRVVSEWGVETSKINVIHNSVEPADFPVNKKTDKFLIITSGREVVWKGFQIVKEVVRELEKEHSDIKLGILNNLPKNEYLQHLNSADVFVLNSGYEGFSHSVLEAMTLGVPVVVSDIGGNRELVKDGENGLLFEYENKDQLKKAILTLYTDKAMAEKFSKTGKETAERFSFESMINKTEELLNSLIQNS